MMSAPGRGPALLRSSHRVCSQCARTAAPLRLLRPSAPTAVAAASQPPPVLPLSARRFYSVETSASTPASSAQQAAQPQTPRPPPPPVASSSSSVNADPTTSTADKTIYRIKAGVILTRPPLLTREQTPFESAFYLYQKRLNERLTAPFRRQFYFKPDSAADLDFRIKLRERRGVPAKDIGRYNPRGRTAWNDEVLVGSRTSDPADVLERLLADAEVRVSEDGEPIAPEERVPVERPAPRRTEADERNDVRRLDRKLDRTLYLVVRKGGSGEPDAGQWHFPSGYVLTEEALHETAARVLAESAGVNMNTWLVGRHPVARHVVRPVHSPDGGGSAVQQRGEKTFFLKGRIMAGQADLTGNKHGLTDFHWLTQEELKEALDPIYYHSVRGMMELR